MDEYAEAESHSTKMANKFVAFVVFAAVLQASLASSSEGSSSVQAAKKLSLAGWNKAADVLFYSLENASLPLNVGKAEYLTAGAGAGIAYLEAARPSDKNQQALQDKLFTRYIKVVDIVYRAVEAARKCKSLAETNKVIDNYQKKLPLEDGAERYLEVAGAKASLSNLLDTLTKLYNNYFLGIKAQAAYYSGQTKSLDKAPKDNARALTKAFTDALYGLLSNTE